MPSTTSSNNASSSHSAITRIRGSVPDLRIRSRPLPLSRASASAIAALTDAASSGHAVANAATDAAGGVSIGSEVESADGESIGTVAGTRTSATGVAQAVIDVNPGLGIGVNQVALDTAGLTATSDTALSIGMEAQEFRDSIQAQLNADADAQATVGASDS